LRRAATDQNAKPDGRLNHQVYLVENSEAFSP
jgi:hypothetical protein